MASSILALEAQEVSSPPDVIHIPNIEEYEFIYTGVGSDRALTITKKNMSISVEDILQQDLDGSLCNFNADEKNSSLSWYKSLFDLYMILVGVGKLVSHNLKEITTLQWSKENPQSKMMMNIRIDGSDEIEYYLNVDVSNELILREIVHISKLLNHKLTLCIQLKDGKKYQVEI